MIKNALEFSYVRWLHEYNDERPHDSLGDPTLCDYLAKTRAWKTPVMGVINKGRFNDAAGF
jgi:hypothetical protein